MLQLVAIMVLTAFKYAFRGCEVVEYEPGLQDVPEEVANLAVEEGWAAFADQSSAPPPADPDSPPDGGQSDAAPDGKADNAPAEEPAAQESEQKDLGQAPENKDAAPQVVQNKAAEVKSTGAAKATAKAKSK